MQNDCKSPQRSRLPTSLPTLSSPTQQSTSMFFTSNLHSTTEARIPSEISCSLNDAEDNVDANNNSKIGTGSGDFTNRVQLPHKWGNPNATGGHSSCHSNLKRYYYQFSIEAGVDKPCYLDYVMNPTIVIPPPNEFDGKCFLCQARNHSQHYCPTRQCNICLVYGHSERKCPRRSYNYNNTTKLHVNDKFTHRSNTYSVDSGNIADRRANFNLKNVFYTRGGRQSRSWSLGGSGKGYPNNNTNTCYTNSSDTGCNTRSINSCSTGRVCGGNEDVKFSCIATHPPIEHQHHYTFQRQPLHTTSTSSSSSSYMFAKRRTLYNKTSPITRCNNIAYIDISDGNFLSLDKINSPKLNHKLMDGHNHTNYNTKQKRNNNVDTDNKANDYNCIDNADDDATSENEYSKFEYNLENDDDDDVDDDDEFETKSARYAFSPTNGLSIQGGYHKRYQVIPNSV